jgi:signal recognition particle receptor subunit beta
MSTLVWSRPQPQAPRRAVVVHTLVSALPAVSSDAYESLTDTAVSVHQCCVRNARPTLVAELASRQQTSPAVAAVAVLDLLDQGLLYQHTTTQEPQALRRIVEALSDPTGPTHEGQSTHGEASLVKMLVVGRSGAGVSTCVAQLGSQAPLVYSTVDSDLRLDASLSDMGAGVHLAVFGASGLDEDSPQWLDLAREAVAALLLIRSEDVADGLGYERSLIGVLDDAQIPFVVAVNLADGADPEADALRHALGVSQRERPVPVVMGDVRLHSAVSRTLTDLCSYLLGGER